MPTKSSGHGPLSGPWQKLSQYWWNVITKVSADPTRSALKTKLLWHNAVSEAMGQLLLEKSLISHLVQPATVSSLGQEDICRFLPTSLVSAPTLSILSVCTSTIASTVIVKMQAHFSTWTRALWILSFVPRKIAALWFFQSSRTMISRLFPLTSPNSLSLEDHAS